MSKNVIITSLPSVGKSTLLKSILDSYPGMTAGMITSEIKKGGNRVGFKMGNYHHGDDFNLFAKTIAHVDLDSDLKVSKYSVNVSEINKQSVLKKRAGFGSNYLLYLDEVGEMQLYSQSFIELAKNYLDAPNTCIMTVSKKYDCAFIDEIKNRDDVEIIELTLENRDTMKTRILEKIAEYSKK